jgi:hypothetical protein
MAVKLTDFGNDVSVLDMSNKISTEKIEDL